MKLKLDENLPRDLADELAARGLDVDTVLDEGLGAPLTKRWSGQQRLRTGCC